MEYPAIVYSREGTSADHANNDVYRSMKQWQITVIDPNPDSTIVEAVENLRYATFARAFRVENLNHTIIDLYF